MQECHNTATKLPLEEWKEWQRQMCMYYSYCVKGGL